MTFSAKRVKLSNESIDHLLFDITSVIVSEMEEREKNEDLYVIRKICDKIQATIDQINPKSFVYIAFDGVGPMAKFDHYRATQYKSYIKQKALNKTWVPSPNIPGTLFMMKLSIAVHAFFDNKNNDNSNKISYKVSTTDEIGEGGYKLFKHMRENPRYYENKNTVVYGISNDLIMLSLGFTAPHSAGQLYLCAKSQEILNFFHFPLMIVDEIYMLNIESLSLDIRNNTMENIFDYIFICILLGNEYMPKFPHVNKQINGFQNLLEVYKTIDKPLTNRNKIIWKHVRLFIEELCKREETLFMDIHAYTHYLEGQHNNHYYANDEEKLNNVPISDLSIEKCINPHHHQWNLRYYRFLFDFDGKDEERKKSVCVNYLEGLEWTFQYYTTSCTDWQWKYKYHYPPLFSDLLSYVPHFHIEFISKKEHHHHDAVSSETQLVYVLPSETEKHKIHWQYCQYFDESNISVIYR